MRGCHSVQNVHSEKHEKSLLFVSVIVPVNNPARRPTVLFLASKENQGAFLLHWEKSLFGLLKKQHRIKE